MSETTIQWTQKVWNPVTGCQKISPGCKNCYAETIAERFWATQYPPNEDGTPRKFTDVRCHVDRLEQPLHWKKPSMIFVNSMSDLFHESVPMIFIRAVFTVMAQCRQHTFQILTKRPNRMEAMLYEWDSDGVTLREGCGVKLPNVWLGVSVEDQRTADERIPLLLQTPAAVRWISAEPLLGPIDFDSTHVSDPCESNFLTGIAGERVYDGRKCALDWVVAGGESGPSARPMDVEWARSLMRQCKAAGVPFFMKQLGGVRDARGELADFPEDLRIREYPA